MANGSVHLTTFNPSNLAQFKPSLTSQMFLADALSLPDSPEIEAKLLDKLIVPVVLHRAK